MTDKVKFGEPTVAGYKRLSENTQDKSNKTSGDEKIIFLFLIKMVKVLKPQQMI